MKTLFICPSVRPAVMQLAEDAPLALTPLLGGCVLSRWIEYAVMRGARHIRIVAADRAEQVRTVLGDGALWGVQLEVIASNLEPTPVEAMARHRPPGESGWLPAPHDVVLMSHLPECQDLPLFESYAGWFAALIARMPLALTPTRLHMSEVQPGVWASRRAHIAATAQLIAPCWIGDQVRVEPGAVVGPAAIIEDRSVVANEARVTFSWVGPDTFVGPMTSVASSVAWGSTLIDWRSDSSVRVPDRFLLCSLAPAPAEEPKSRRVPEPARAREPQLNWIADWPAPTPRVQGSNRPA